MSIYLHSNFSGGLPKTISFLQEWSFSRSMSSKLLFIEFGTNQKRACDFLLLRDSNLGPILHCLGDIPAFMCSWPHNYSTLILGVFPLHQIAHVGVNVSRCLKLFGREPWNSFWSIPTYVITVPKHYRQTDRQTDGRTDRWHKSHNRALRSIAR